jgi:hypothetical protein
MSEECYGIYSCILSGAKLCKVKNSIGREMLKWRYTGYGDDYYHSDLTGGSGARSVVFLYKWAIVE